MVEVLWVLVVLSFVYLGWIYFRNPQEGFRTHTAPLAPRAGDGLTEEGEPAYRLRGAFILALGLFLVLMGLLG